jgi:signal transduction histidine kinase
MFSISMWIITSGLYERMAPGAEAFIVGRERYIDDYLEACLGEGLDQASEVSLLDEMGLDISYALDAMATKAEREQAEEQLAAQAGRLKILADASGEFAEARTDFQAVVDRVTLAVGEAFGDSCWVRLLSDDEEWLDVASLYDTDPLVRDDAYAILTHERQPVADSGIASQAFQSGLPAFIPVITQEQLRASSPPRLWPLLQRFAIHGVIAAPLRVGGRSIGVLGLTRHQSDLPAFTEEDMNLVQDLADRAAMAISNTRLLSQLGDLNRDLELRVQKRTEEYESANEELIAANEELAGVNEELTSTNEELADTNTRLDEATRAKSEFLASMSHELRTPLNFSILGFSGMLAMGLAGPLNAEQNKQVSMINTSGKHLLALINQVLDLAKVEAGETDVSLEDVDVAAVVTGLGETIRPLAESKGLEVRIQCPAELSHISTDRMRLEQILLNLLGNAVKFTDAGYVGLAVREGDDSVVVDIEDTGRGISKKDMGRIFEEFFQVSAPGATKTVGTGLGLGLSRKLAEMLGGDIGVESELGRGSTFSLRLPLRTVVV